MTNINKELNKDQSQELTGQTLDIAKQKQSELEQLFPGIFTETKNDAGEIVKTVDVERLKAELGEYSEIYDNRKERYGMDWPGKKDCLRLIQEPTTATLNPCEEESVDFHNTENLFIEGDNLEVLKILQKSYYGEVKMIYIDPPYNTGKEFIYPDNFNENLDTYLEYAGLKETEGEGRKWSTNSQNEGRFHTKWLNMMYPRLYLARNLLREDGVIFISIDDNEVENLRRMCDEVFGENNYITSFMWKRKKEISSDTKNVSIQGEYIVAVGKSEKAVLKLEPLSEEYIQKSYKDPDQNYPDGKWRPVPLTVSKGLSGGGYNYIITSPNGSEHNRLWAYPEKSFRDLVSSGRIYWGKDGCGIPQRVIYAHESSGQPTTNFWEDTSSNKAGKKILLELFGDNYFDTVKPIELIQRLTKLVVKDGDIALDFFAGSGTSAHAIMDYCLNTNLRVRFISVQLPEPTNDNSVANKNGFKIISNIAKERIRRAGIQLLKSNESEKIKTSYKIDLGFKVLKLNQSNFKQWQSPDIDIEDADLIKQMELNVDHVDENIPKENLLYELLIKSGIKPTVQIEEIEIVGQKIYSVDEGLLLIHLEDDITAGLIEEVLKQEPQQFICLDKAFEGNDQLKTNAYKTFESFNENKQGIERIEFKTV